MSTIQRHTLRTVHQAVAARADFDCNGTLKGHAGISGTWGSRLPERYFDKFRSDALADDFYCVRSYATPIAWFANGAWHVPNVKYSPTTSRHLSALHIGLNWPATAKGADYVVIR